MDADVIVVGAGPAGCAVAVRLTERGYNVLVLERRPGQETEENAGGELLSPAAQRECVQLGLRMDGDWAGDRVDGIRNVYPDLSWTYHPFPDGLVWINAHRSLFTAALRRRVVTVGARLEWGARVNAIDVDAHAVRVCTSEGAEYRAGMLVDCGGRHAPSLTALDLKAEEPEFRQIAVAIFFSSFRDAALNTWDRHLYGEHGAMISGSRIRPGLYRWILEADLADKQAERSRPVEFFEQISQRYDAWVYERVMSEPRLDTWAMAPIAYRATALARDRHLLAGDATGYLSPITGQGIEFAMRMGRLAAEAVDDALSRGDVSAAGFTSYVEARQQEVVRAVAHVRTQLRIFRDREALLRAARDDAYRLQVFGPICAVTAERGSLALS
jgi:flavin-dependent dehydrogenase